MRNYSYPGMAVLMGAVGLLLRRLQLKTCFVNGLPVEGSATSRLIQLLIVAAVALAVLVNPLKGGTDWRSVFGERPKPLLKLAAVGYAAALVLYVVYEDVHSAGTGVFAYTAVVMPAAMLAGLLGGAIALWMLSGKGVAKAMPAMLPGFCGCFWMVNAYHHHANDPVVLNFVWLLLAAAASGMAWYEVAAFGVGRGHSRMAAYWMLMAVVLCLTCLGGAESVWTKALLVSQVVAFLCLSSSLLSRMELVGFRLKDGKPENKNKE